MNVPTRSLEWFYVTIHHSMHVHSKQNVHPCLALMPEACTQWVKSDELKHVPTEVSASGRSDLIFVHHCLFLYFH